jgi:hypothetical protein
MECFMRRKVLLTLVGLSVMVTSGCTLKEVYPTAAIPSGGVRFINAVPDTAGAFGLDLRFVDELESNAHFRQNFRNGPITSGGVTGSAGIQYKQVRAGSRRFRIFLNDTLQSVAQVVLADTTVTITAGSNYSAILWGNARGTAPAMRLTFLEETVADPSPNVAVRVINATPTALDVRVYLNGGTVPGTATWANVAALSASTHISQAPGSYRFNVQPAGGGATLFADALTLPGVAAFSTAGPSGKLDIEALPGTTVAGSAVTLIVFPRSTAGARTPQPAAFTVPAPVSIWDRRPTYVQP